MVSIQVPRMRFGFPDQQGSGLGDGQDEVRVCELCFSEVNLSPHRTASEGSGLVKIGAPPLPQPAETAAGPSTFAAARGPLHTPLK